MKPIKIKVGDVEYTVTIPIYMIPLLSYLKEKVILFPKSFEDAKKSCDDLQKILDEFRKYVKPEADDMTMIVLLFKTDEEYGKRFKKAFNAGNFTADKENPLIK
ncbi:MAG: hypothetical protein ACXQTR_05525 [Candidatus Methanospirareceae archaeon]